MQALKDRVALVTGASSGIGEAIARALSAEGARVLLTARRKERLQTLARELPGSTAIELDVRDPSRVMAALAKWPVDIAVANAGLGRGMEPLHQGSPEDWSEMLDTNVKGVLHTLRAVVPGMVERQCGDIVFLGSVAGRQVYPSGAVYCASKFAVRALYEGLRLEVNGKNIRCTTIDPGMVKTDFSEIRFKGDRERAAKVYAGVDALTPEDIADLVRFVVTRPRHVNIGELVVWATQQASTTMLARRT
jgi:NADP-dependent 3-hydroxy acid dehydrogenase YdfG